MIRLFTAFAAGVLLAATATSQIPFGVVLNGASEVPPVATAATGTARVTLNLPAQTLTYRVETSGLTGTAAHIHPGVAGMNGGILIPLVGGPTVWEGTTPPLSNPDVIALMTDALYINVHTMANSGGEIRGQLTPLIRRPLVAHLDGSQENPPVATAATGHATFHLNTPFMTVDYDVRTMGVAGTAAHIHPGAVGMNGGILKTLVGGPSQWAGTTTPMTPTEAADLLAGNHYVNVHSVAHSGGEIRGQIGLSPHVRFVARLDGTQENPPIPTPATGFASFILDETTGNLMFDVSVSGLMGSLTASHIHGGVLRQNGGILVNLAPPMGGSSWSGMATLTPAQIDTLYRGGLYVNVHTSFASGGEIRGQMVPNPLAFGYGFDAAGQERRIDALHGGPEQGSPFTVTLTGAPANVPCDLFLSDNTDSIFGLPLPLFTPSGPVWIDASLLFFLPLSSNSVGSASLTLIVPNDPALRGVPVYWQWLISEPAGITLSGGLQTVIQ
jgi:hypothetical protein